MGTLMVPGDVGAEVERPEIIQGLFFEADRGSPGIVGEIVLYLKRQGERRAVSAVLRVCCIEGMCLCPPASC